MVEELGRRAGERTVEPASIGGSSGGLAVETSRSPSDYLERNECVLWQTMNALFLCIGPRLFAKRAMSVSCYLVGNYMYNLRRKLSHNHISNSRPMCMLRTEIVSDLVRRHLVVH